MLFEILGWMMEYFAVGSTMGESEAYLYGSGVVAMAALYTFTHHAYFFGVMHTGMRIRVAACSLIYRKVSYYPQRLLLRHAIGHEHWSGCMLTHLQKGTG
jgi:hypothetical protein